MLTTPSQKFRQAIPTASLSHLQRLAAKLTDIRNVDPSSRQTSLQLAVLNGRQDVVEWLVLDEGHDDGEISRDTLGETCCHIAAAAGHVGILELYVSQYPFVLAWVNSRGGTPLHLAAMKGEVEAAQFLLESGADIDAPDLQGNTPLHYASSYDKLAVIKLLIESDCQSGQRNNEGFTASDYSYSFSCQRALEEYIRTHADNLKQAKKNQKSSSKASPRIPRSVRVDTTPARSHTPQPQTPEEMTPTLRDRGEFGLGFAYNASRPGSIHQSSPSMPSSVPLSPSNSAQANPAHMTPPTTSHGSSSLSPNRPKPPSSSPNSPLSLRTAGRSTSSTSQLGPGPQDETIIEPSPPTTSTEQGPNGALIRPTLSTRDSSNLLRRGASRSSSFSSMTTTPVSSTNTVTQSQSQRTDRSRSESNTSSLLSSGGNSTTSSASAFPAAVTSTGPTSAYRSRSISNLSSDPSQPSRSRSGSSALPPPPLNLVALSSRDLPSNNGTTASVPHSPPPPTPPSATTKPTTNAAAPSSSTSTLMSKGPSLTGSEGTKNSRAGSTVGDEKKEKEKERGRSASNESNINGGRVARAFGLGKRS